jgi:hypothetical protein
MELKILKCINQVFRPSGNTMLENGADCSLCTTDEKNKECKYYQPVKVEIIFIDVKAHAPSADQPH